MSTDTTAHKHPFHIIDPSPWPAVGAFGALILAIGLVRYMHGSPPWLLAVGVAVVLATMAGWWRDVIHESVVERAHTRPVRHGLRLGMALFIASEAMFFAAFFWAYFHNALHVSPVIDGTWPPQGIEPLDAFGLPLVNTIILISSGVVLMGGRRGLEHGRRRQMVACTLVAALLGLTFLVLQAVEYGEAAFAFDSGIYASAFYMATGFHGFHVLVGAIMLLVMAFRGLAGHHRPEAHVGFQAAEWYWHFVDAVWIILFTFFYVWVGLGA
jgi:heme/copper-type cytochrome/quinol oxidase subunit 3